MPTNTADTVHNQIKDDFCRGRSRLKQELATTCSSIALSLDVWTSETKVAILGVIGYWMTPDFEKREELLEFTEIRRPHSGENDKVLLTTLEELQIASKLLKITGDNAGKKGTPCDYLHAELRSQYGGEDD